MTCSSGQIPAILDIGQILCSLCDDALRFHFRFWFNFFVAIVYVGQTVVFNIVNLSKTRNLLTDGMTPVVRSTSRPTWSVLIIRVMPNQTQTNTLSCCRQRLPLTSVFYYISPDHNNNYVLSFAFTFDTEEEKYQFALNYPYSHSR